MPHGIAHEILQLTEAQRLLLDVSLKYFAVSHMISDLMKYLPLIGVAEQRVTFMKITSAEGLQWVFLSHGL